jgi:D-glycero-alpha-D-manno-heptose-7-phosphate kinase
VVITQTPVRISFFGGGTDYPTYFREHGGATLTVAINQHTVITVHPLTRFADHKIRVHYSVVESVNELDEIRHPSARECLRFLDIHRGVEIHYVSNLPARTGLGSSSSATVGLLHALHAFKGELVSREQLAAEAVHVEQNLIRERVGSQDQYACALGGFRHLEFHRDGSVQAAPVPLNAEQRRALQDRLLLLYTGVQRNAHDILGEQVLRTQNGANEAELRQMRAIVDAGVTAITGKGSLPEFGALLHQSWQLKRKLSSRISSASIDSAYERARQAGAVGGKLLGAGGGGFLLLFAEPERHSAIVRQVPEYQPAAFSFEDAGTQIIFYQP